MALWNVVVGVAWRTLKNWLTNPQILLPTMAFPLFFFTAFAGGLSQVSQVPGFDFPPGYTAFQFVFVLLQSAAFSGVFVGFGVARDFENGFAKRLMLAAPRRGGIVLGYALAAFLRWAIVALVLTTVALVVGMNIGGGAVDVVGLYTLAALVNFCGFFWAGGMAMRFRTIQAAPLMQMPVFLVLFFAPVYVPLNLLQGWIHGVAIVNPLTYLLETGRGFVANDAPHVLGAFGIAIGLGVLFWIWAFRGLRSAEAAGPSRRDWRNRCCAAEGALGRHDSASSVAPIRRVSGLPASSPRADQRHFGDETRSANPS
jgi:ABC-2 type transport system permease protein